MFQVTMNENLGIYHQQVKRIFPIQSYNYHSIPSSSLEGLLINEFPQDLKFENWAPDEIEKLVLAVKINGNKNWENAQISLERELQNNAEINGFIVFNQI
jgi:hypothetical protein